MSGNDMYLKMVSVLPDEFFDGWEWQAGDKYLINYGDYWDIGFIGDSSIENREVGYYFITVGEFQKFREELRPLPSQEQLQKLSGLDWDLYYHDLVKNYSEYDSDEQAGLAMITYMKYGKIWNGTKWIKNI